ncbi:MAG: hypothetical protein AB1295_05615 [Candidatus Micrarchaeota archaeon]
MFGSCQEKRLKKKAMGLTTELEMAYEDPTRYGVVVDAASQLCDLLKDDCLSLTASEKVRVLKTLSRAKAKALRTGASENYRTFRVLDEISGDLVRLL